MRLSRLVNRVRSDMQVSGCGQDGVTNAASPSGANHEPGVGQPPTHPTEAFISDLKLLRDDARLRASDTRVGHAAEDTGRPADVSRGKCERAQVAGRGVYA